VFRRRNDYGTLIFLHYNPSKSIHNAARYIDRVLISKKNYAIYSYLKDIALFSKLLTQQYMYMMYRMFAKTKTKIWFSFSC